MRRVLAASVAVGAIVAFMVVSALAPSGSRRVAPAPSAPHVRLVAPKLPPVVLPPASAPEPPAPAPAPVPAPVATYTVRPGDTLFRIGARVGVSAGALCASNGIADCDLIFPGQVLRWTPGGVTPPAPRVVAPGRSGGSAGRVAPPAARVAPPTVRVVAPAGGCGAALAYLAAHAAPGFKFVCAPNAAHAPCSALSDAAIGCTSGGPGGGTIYISSQCAGDPQVYEDEAANSRKLAGLAPASQPIDPFSVHRSGPYGAAPCYA